MTTPCRRRCLGPGKAGANRRAGNIILVGFMGSGKTTVGKSLASRLGWRFTDLDRQIEREQGMKVRDIFKKRGEAFFRGLEHRAIRRLKGSSHLVVAAGGGAPAFARNREWLKRAGYVVYLKVPVSVLAERLADAKDRPLLFPAGGRKTALRRLISGILSRREACYRRADFVVNVGRSSVAGTVRKLERMIHIDRQRRTMHEV